MNRDILPTLKLLSTALLAVALAGCSGESKVEKAGPPVGANPPATEVGTSESPSTRRLSQGMKRRPRRLPKSSASAARFSSMNISPGRPVYGVNFADVKVGDDALADLDSLPQLKVLILSRTKVTDAGLVHVERLSQLTGLMLDDTRVTDAGLQHIRNLRSLEELLLDGTKVTDAGLQHLERLISLRRLGLIGTQVTDAGLEHLEGLGHLRGITLFNTKVTKAGIAKSGGCCPREHQSSNRS